MTDKQPEALRLADELDCRGMNRPSWEDQFDAGYELRRLHEVNAELVEALKRCAASLNPNHEHTAFVFAALAKAQGENND